MSDTKIILEEKDMPRQWYNLAADLPSPMLPPLGPDGNPIGPEMLAPIAESEFGAVRQTHQNLNDGTNEGLECLDVEAFSVQYHPEAAPGPNDAQKLFDRFVGSIGGPDA